MQSILRDYFHENLIDLALNSDELVNQASTRVYQEFAELTGIYIREQDHENWANFCDDNMFDFTPNELAEKIIALRYMYK